MTKISIIIPTYKEPEYLDLCLESIYKTQTQENQVIVVVDGYYEINRDIIEKYKDKPGFEYIVFEDNKGLSTATNWGVYCADGEWILVVNDDNVFPEEWDISLLECIENRRDSRRAIISPNQIEPKPSMFRQFHIKDLGKSVEDFKLERFIEYEKTISRPFDELTGSTLPFFMKRVDFLSVGGWDLLFPSPHVVDWDFFARCEHLGFDMVRTYRTHFYHFAGAATKRTAEDTIRSNKLENQGYEFFRHKWKTYPQHREIDNSKKLDF